MESCLPAETRYFLHVKMGFREMFKCFLCNFWLTGVPFEREREMGVLYGGFVPTSDQGVAV